MFTKLMKPVYATFRRLGNIILFASRLNNQIRRYSSWKSDPDAEFVNAFSCCWSQFYSYAFPPFSLVSRTLQNVRTDQADCLIVVHCGQPSVGLL